MSSETNIEKDMDLDNSSGASNATHSINQSDVQDASAEEQKPAERKYVAYTVKLPSDQLAALQSIWLELKKLYGTHSPDKSGMIEAAVTRWLKDWDGPERDKLLAELLEIRENTRRRQYKKR